MRFESILSGSCRIFVLSILAFGLIIAPLADSFAQQPIPPPPAPPVPQSPPTQPSAPAFDPAAGRSAPAASRQSAPPTPPADMAAAEGACPTLTTCRTQYEADMRNYGADPSEAGSDPSAGCDTRANIADASCNTMSILGMSPEAGAMTELAIGQATQLFQQMQAQGRNQAQQCQSQANLSRIMASISALKAAACGTNMNACKNRCQIQSRYHDCRKRAVTHCMSHPVQPPNPGQSALRPLSTYETQMASRYGQRSATCSRYGQNMMMMVMQGMNFGSAMAQNQQCANLTSSSTPVPGATMPPWGTPPGVTLPGGGSATCDDPTYAATSLACICQKDPTNRLCGGGTGGPTGGTGPTGNGVGTPGRPFSPGTGVGSNGRPIDQTQAKANTQGGSNITPDGQMGGLGGGQGGGMGGVGDQGGGAAPSTVDKNVIQGVSGAGGGMGGGSGGGGGGGGFNPGGGRGGSDESWFNLKKFLPNKKDFKNRGLAGMTVPAVDGVTGPMGPSLWEKVTNQYQVQKPNLITDR